MGLGDWGSLEGFETNYITKKQSARILLDAATAKNAEHSFTGRNVL